jgi:hypothetical protein
MSSISSIVARGSALLRTRDETSANMSTTMIDLLIALMVLIFISLLLVGALYTVHKIRRSRAISRQQLPTYNDSKPVTNHRRLTITAAPYGRGSSIYVYDEKSSILSSPSSPPVPRQRSRDPDYLS